MTNNSDIYSDDINCLGNCCCKCSIQCRREGGLSMLSCCEGYFERLWDFHPDSKPSKIFYLKEIMSIIINILLEITIVIFCIRSKYLGYNIFSIVFEVLFSLIISLFLFLTFRSLISSDETEFSSDSLIKRSKPYIIILILYILLIIIYAILSCVIIETCTWNIVILCFALIYLVINFSLKLSVDLLLRFTFIVGIAFEIAIRQICFIIFYRCRCCKEKNCCGMKAESRRQNAPSKVYEIEKNEEKKVNIKLQGKPSIIEFESHIYVGKSCLICLEIFTENDKIIKLTCNDDHVFHKDCFNSWNQDSKICPICSQQI